MPQSQERPLSALEEFDRRNAEIADWRRIEPRVLPGVTSMHKYRAATSMGLADAYFMMTDGKHEVAPPAAVTVRDLHGCVFRSATRDAGMYRKPGQPVTFGGRLGADPMRIDVEMKRLEAEMGEMVAACRTKEDQCAAIAFYHARLIGIHPFVDGNGRVGRVLMQAQAAKFGMKLDMTEMAADRAGYIEAAGAALDSGNITPLTRIVGKCCGVEITHQSDMVAHTRVSCRPMLDMDDIHPLAEEREMAKTCFPMPLPSVRNPDQAREMGM